MITSEPGYICAKITGQVSFPELFGVLLEVQANENYHRTNDIWCFGDCYFGFSADQLRTLADSINSHYPKGASRTKTALVVSSGLAEGMASVWMAIAAILPYQTKVFRSFADAERWILE